MISVDRIISELKGVKNALGDAGVDPMRHRPRLGPVPVPERVGSRPIIFGDDMNVADPDRWDDKKQGARNAIEGGTSSAGGAQHGGTEALAWYVSFHENQHRWGIYIPLSSLALMDELYLAGVSSSRSGRLRLAWEVLLLHEQTHFAFDYACAWFELLLRAPVRREFYSRFTLPPPLSVMTVAEHYLQVEETAANAHMLRNIGRSRSSRVLKRIQQFVATQPPGYRDALSHTDDDGFNSVVADTIQSYVAIWALEYGLQIGSSALDLELLVPLDTGALLDQCPVYVIDDLEDAGLVAGSIKLIYCITHLVESKGFLKQFQLQGAEIQKDWIRKKNQIKIGLPSPPRFEKLKGKSPPVFSLRLRDGHRVHLQPDSAEGAWCAIAIGNHKEMGHG